MFFFFYVHHGFSWTLTYESMKWKGMHFHLKTCFDPNFGCFMDWLSAIFVVHWLHMCHCFCHWDEWEYTLCPVICELVLAFLFILYAVDLNVDLAQQFCWSGLFCLSSLQLHQQIHHIVFSTTHPTQTFFIWSREAKMFRCINGSLFIVKSRSAHWHTVHFSLCLWVSSCIRDSSENKRHPYSGFA